MRRLLLSTVLLLFLPKAAMAVTLEWAGGATELTFTSTRTCTLVVKPSAGEAALPIRWRLFWVGVASVETPVQVLLSPGPATAAAVCGYEYPHSEEDRLSHTASVDFCPPAAGGNRTGAAFVVRLDGSLEARFTVTPEFGALPEGDVSGAVVTVNGGSTLDFPAGLRTYRPLPDTLGVRRAGLVGRGFDRVHSAVVVHPGTGAPNDTLEILDRSDQTLLLRRAAQEDPRDVLLLSNGADEPVTATAITDPDPTTSSFGPHMIPDYPYEAKDFAFIHTNGQFHIFYDRINPLNTSQSETDFGHAVSQNLYNWTQLAPVMKVRPGKWDDLHVWAPTIVEQNGTFYMFYTGVSSSAQVSSGIQRIGLAISTDLEHWTRFDDPLFTCASVPWTYCDYSTWEGSQFRDPFVMADPTNPGHWLMYYSTTPAVATDQLIIGAATSPALDSGWGDLKPMWITDRFPPNFMGYAESSMAFSKSNYWFLFVSTNSGHPIGYRVTTSTPVADSTDWTGPYRFYDVPGAGGNTDQWIAPEFLRYGGHDYFAAVTRAAVTPGVEIREMIWGNLPSFSVAPPAVTAVGPGGGAGTLALAITTPVGGAGGVEFRMDHPAAGPARLEIFDVSGRRVAMVTDGWRPAGTSSCRWDGRTSEKGMRAESGLYFARLVTSHERTTIRVPHFR